MRLTAIDDDEVTFAESKTESEQPTDLEASLATFLRHALKLRNREEAVIPEDSVLDEIEARAALLKELGVEAKDVMEDEKGEYIMVEEEEGLKKKYL